MVIPRVKLQLNSVEWAMTVTDLGDNQKAKLRAQTRWLDHTFEHYLQPTVQQLGNFARVLHVPFAKLLQQTPPEFENIRLAFRTQVNAPVRVSLTVRDVIYEMQRKQAWFKEGSGQATQQLSLIASAQQMSEADTFGELAHLLKLEHMPTARELYGNLRRQMAQLDVLTMQKGGAGLGTNRPLPVESLRAFTLFDEYAPLIFVNQKDSYTARIFSLVHEFVHLLRGTDELLTGEDHDIAEERLISHVVAQFLMPRTEFIRRFDAEDVTIVARYFHVSPQAALIRAKHLSLIENPDAIVLPDLTEHQPVKSGGNPYNNALSLNDPRYMQVLVAAQEQGLLQPTKAASLIGVSPKMLDKTVATFSEREALGCLEQFVA